MAESNALNLFKQTETHDKVTIILELLRAYKDLGEYDINACKKRLAWAFQWWGIEDDTLAKSINDGIENGEIKEVKDNVFKIIVTLMHTLSPSENIMHFLDS